MLNVFHALLLHISEENVETTNLLLDDSGTNEPALFDLIEELGLGIGNDDLTTMQLLFGSDFDDTESKSVDEKRDAIPSSSTLPPSSVSVSTTDSLMQPIPVTAEIEVSTTSPEPIPSFPPLSPTGQPPQLSPQNRVDNDVASEFQFSPPHLQSEYDLGDNVSSAYPIPKSPNKSIQSARMLPKMRQKKFEFGFAKMNAIAATITKSKAEERQVVRMPSTATSSVISLPRDESKKKMDESYISPNSSSSIEETNANSTLSLPAASSSTSSTASHEKANTSLTNPGIGPLMIANQQLMQIR